MRRAGILVGVGALLLGAGVTFALWGFRALSLERDHARREARQRTAEALDLAARAVRERATDPPGDPLQVWTVEVAPTGAPPRDDEDAVGALLVAEAAHLDQPDRDPEGALRVLDRVVREHAESAWAFVAAGRAGAVARRLGRTEEARRFLAVAASAPPTLLDPDGVSVLLRARYLAAALALRRLDASAEIETFLDDVGDGRQLSPPEVSGPDDLVLALFGLVFDPPPYDGESRRFVLPPSEWVAGHVATFRGALGEDGLQQAEAAITRLFRARATVREGLHHLAALPADGIFALADGTYALRRGDRLERHHLQTLLGAVPSDAQAGRPFVWPVGLPLAEDEIALPLTEPFSGLELRAVVPEPPAGRGAVLGLAAGLVVYLLGTVLALVAIHRSQRAARMQGEFVAAVSHDLKTPIAGVRAMAEMLADDPEPPAPRVRDYARRIGAEMERLGASVRNVLDAARIERQGRMPVRLESGDPGASVEAVAAAYRSALEGRGFAFLADVRPAGRNLPYDAAALQGAVANLLDNALKFSPDRREIELLAAPTEGGYRIEVQDRGRGLGTTRPERLFRRFERGAEARRDHVPGVGLGLFVVKQVAEAHGGRVHSAPRAGGGTVFVLTLPWDPARGGTAT